MVHGTVRHLFQLLGAVLVTLLVVATWFAYRLSEGPIALDLLTPYLENAFASGDGRLAVKLDRTVLVWNGNNHTLQIRVDNARAISDNQLVAAVPQMSVGLSGRALLHGVVAPRGLRLLRPVIRLRRDAAGHMQFGLGEVAETGDNAQPAVAELFAALLGPPGGEGSASELHSVDVVAADLSIDDEAAGRHWHAPRADLKFIRDRRGITGVARLDLEFDGQAARLDADGVYRRGGTGADVTVSFSGIRPSLFAELAPQLSALTALKLPVGGQMALHMGADGMPTDIRFDMAGGQGVLDASPWVGNVAWQVQGMAIKGSLAEGLSQLSLDELRVDLGGPVLSASGKVQGLGGDLHLQGQARLDEVPVDDLKHLWPADLAPHPRNWIVANLSHGKVRYATVKLAAHLPPGAAAADLAIDEVAGEVAPEGVTVQYLPPMPPVHNVSGLAHYDANTFVIDVKGGEAAGLAVPEGKITLNGLSADLQTADIRLKVIGPVSSSLKLIDSKPLGWASKLGVDPDKVKGDALTRLNLQFPLLAQLSLDQLKVTAEAQTSRLGLSGLPLGLELAEGNFTLDVDTKGMDVVGKGRLNGTPADIRWHENFVKAAPFRSRYQLAFAADDAMRRSLGLDSEPFQAPFLSGPVPLELTAQLGDGGTGTIDVKADLGPAALTLPGLNWDKPVGIAGQAQAGLRLAGGKLAEVPRFTLGTANGLAIEGGVDFDAGQARRIVFRRAKWGRTEAQGQMVIRPGHAGLALDIGGASLDARELVAGRPSDHLTDRAAPRQRSADAPAPAHQREAVTPMSVQAKFARVWVSDSSAVRDLSASLTRDSRDWQQARIDATLPDVGKPVHIGVQPMGDNRRRLTMTSPDAGAVFRTFDVFENVMGGDLAVEGSFDDADPRQPLTGVARVTDYQVVKAPGLARLLTVAALTGIVEVLSGEGIHFSTLEAPFTLTDGVLELHDARAYGTSLGLTAKGQVDLDTNVIALEGTVVPVYALNSALGNIPLVGPLFSAEKGGGILAMNYSMKGPADAPSVMVNPLSALTPGFLRRLFNIFDDGSGTEVRPRNTPAPAQPAPVDPNPPTPSN